MQTCTDCFCQHSQSSLQMFITTRQHKSTRNSNTTDLLEQDANRCLFVFCCGGAEVLALDHFERDVPRFLPESIYKTAQILSEKTPFREKRMYCTAKFKVNSHRIMFLIQGKNLEETLGPVFSAKEKHSKLNLQGLDSIPLLNSLHHDSIQGWEGGIKKEILNAK